MLTRSKEVPSVASTRILKTHRMNEVETFRLQGRIKNISTESKHNYSQISDEIAGVRKNLTKIKDVPISHGISVERRKLLHEQGMRILPPGRGNESTWKVKTVDGKEFAIENAEFYDGASLRRKISSTSTKPPTPHSITSSEEAKETVEKEDKHFTSKSIPYRVITPPHRPGSRQNFKVVERNGSSDEEERTRHVLDGYRRRAHTARLVRRQGTRSLLRPRSHTCPNVVAVGKDESALNSTAAEPNGITSRPSSSCGSITEEKGEARKREIKTSPAAHQDNSKGGHSRARASSSGDLRLGRHPDMHRRGPGETRRVNSDSTDIIILTKQVQQFGIDNDENIASRSNAKVAWADNRRPERHLMPEDKGTNPQSIAGNPPLKSEEHKMGRLNSNKTLESRTKRRNERNGGTSHKEKNASSSRRGRALMKDFTTMQMTIGNKQIKVHIPKFNSDLGDNVVDRARVGRPRLSSVSSQ